MRTSIAIAVALMLVLAGCSQAPDTGTTTDTAVDTTVDTTQSSTSETTAADRQKAIKPADPQSDVLGWEAGHWYNETVAVNPNDGLNATELNKTVSRAMARVEQVRGLEFEKRVPVEIKTRKEFRQNQQNGSTPPKRRTFDNAKFEALFMINESADSIAVQNTNTGSAVGGFYSPSEQRIVVISENTSTPKLDEITLSQELFHALQDQKFNLSSLNQSTRELHNAGDGIIEGDGNYVDHLYSQRCKNEWGGQCLTPQTGGNSSGGGLANIGPYLLKFQPYSDGPAFVRGIQRRGGWDAVDDVYANPPASTEQVIHPDKYGKDAPAEFSVEDTSGESWNRLTLKGRPNYASVGEAGIFSMLMYPYYESQGQTQIFPAQQFFNINQSTGELRKFDPLNYNSTYSTGWDGDKLFVYTSDEAAVNETAYVWKTKWDSTKDAEEFVEAYRKLLEYNSATKVEGRPGTWRISDGDEFGDAFYVRQTGDTVVIVNAPTVADLSEVHEGAGSKS